MLAKVHKNVLKTVSVLFLMILMTSGCATQNCATTEDLMNQSEWKVPLQRGEEIFREISSLAPEEIKKLKFGIYRDEVVAFRGGNFCYIDDLLIGNGFYIRVVHTPQKNFRPNHCMWYEVLARGKILQVYPENKIIVLEVSEDNWSLINIR